MMPSSPDSTSAPQAVRTPAAEFWRKFKRQRVALVACGFILFLVLVALLAPWLVPFDPENFFDYDVLNAPPSAAHWFGVDAMGRDIFSRILMGTRISLAAGFISVAAGALVGTTLGMFAGYYEGWWDRIVMRMSDVLFAFGKSTLKAEGLDALNALYQQIVEFQPKDGNAVVVGYTDRIGSDAYNQKLSEARARTVANFLVSKGMAASKVAIEGRGEANPVTGTKCNGVTAKAQLISCLAPDRRVEVRVSGVQEVQQ